MTTTKLVKKITTVALAISFILPLFSAKNARAADRTVDEFLGGQYYNNLISDWDFVDINSMDATSIQSFLVNQNSYLKDYNENGWTAAQIIDDAAHGRYSAAVGPWKGIDINSTTGTISPKVILVMLQKEQSLVTKTAYDERALKFAMGYGCPDETGCSTATHLGFSEQVGWGSWQLRANFEGAKKSANWWNDNNVVSPNYIGQTKVFNDYNNDYTVTYSNAATAAHYRYTPHVFDSAYNFWKIYLRWFSATPPPAVVNDYSAVSAKTYQGSYIYTGAKTADSKVYLNDTLLADLTAPTWQANFSLNAGSNDFTITFKNTDGIVMGTKTISIKRCKTSDANDDGAVESTDLSILADQWSKSVAANTGADFNGDGVVDSTDLSILADAWGK